MTKLYCLGRVGGGGGGMPNVILVWLLIGIFAMNSLTSKTKIVKKLWNYGNP